MEVLYIVFAGLLGLVLGSFANAVAYRIPTGESLMTRSHCTSCQKEIGAWENIPLLSWLFLRGRCRKCKEPISFRYFFVEALTAITFTLLALRSIDLGGMYVYAGLIFATFAFVGVVISLVDIDTFTIPTNFVYGGFAVIISIAIAHSFATGDNSRAMRGLIVAAIFFVIYYLLWFFALMGFGDVRLISSAGFVLGWVSYETAFVGFFMPFVVAMLYSIPALVRKYSSKKDRQRSEIPFGPWIIAGTILAILYGDIMVVPYLRLSGL